MAFQVDAILSSVSELQKEKVSKEVLLNELTSQRLKLHNDLEKVRDKHSKITALHSKSDENLKISEQKLVELDGLVNHYERVNTQKRLAIGRHTNEMETDKMSAQDGLGSFEDTITELTSKFRTAVTFYSPPSLEREIQDKNTLKESLKLKVEGLQVKLTGIRDHLNKVSPSVDTTCEPEIIDEKSQSEVLEMWRRGIENCEKLIQCEMKKRQSLESQLKELRSKLQLIQQQS